MGRETNRRPQLSFSPGGITERALWVDGSGVGEGSLMAGNKGANHYRWKGGKSVRGKGYISIGENYEHVLIAEKILGKTLPLNAVVHHINGIVGDNRPANLVLCQDQASHKLIHLRQKAFYECGNINWRKCVYCKQWDNPQNMYLHNRAFRHRFCENKRRRQLYQDRNNQNKIAAAIIVRRETPLPPPQERREGN